MGKYAAGGSVRAVDVEEPWTPVLPAAVTQNCGALCILVKTLRFQEISSYYFNFPLQ
jgi:hypothetical protein